MARDIYIYIRIYIYVYRESFARSSPSILFSRGKTNSHENSIVSLVGNLRNFFFLGRGGGGKILGRKKEKYDIFTIAIFHDWFRIIYRF